MENLKNIVTVGDLHGKFAEFGYRIKERYKITDSIICCAGDIGMGFHKFNYYKHELSRVNKIAKERGNTIIAVRGNHDDPSYFNGSFDMSNFKFVPDYTVYENILFIGGGISIDRHQRTPNVDYWFNEIPYYDEEKLKDVNPLLIITHSAPSFCDPTTKIGLEAWMKYDKELGVDCAGERLVFDKVFDYLKANDKLPKYWNYGHFHRSTFANHFGINFKCNDELEFHQLYA